VKNDPELCSEQVPWAVLALHDGRVESCHSTEDAAQARLEELYASEVEAAAAHPPTDISFLEVVPMSSESFTASNGTATTVTVAGSSTAGLTVAPTAPATPPADPREEHGAAPVHHTATREGNWDAGTHVGRLPSPMSTSVANRVFAWYDPDAVEDGQVTKNACSLPHHEVNADGQPGAAILNGVRNALARLNQTSMPDSDREAARTHLRAHLDDAPENDGDVRFAAPRAPVAVPVSPVPVTGVVRSDLRNLPPEVLERIAAQRHDVGVVDRVGRGLCELRFRPEFRMNEDGTAFLHGYATVYDFPYEVMGGPPFGWVETITLGACLRSVQNGADVRLLVNHDGIALARTKSGTLRLESDGTGLYSCAPSLDTRSPTVQSLISAMQRGDMDEMSFAFKAIEQVWNEDYTERQITEVKLYDVSVVTYPANPATVTAIRGEDEVLGDDPDALPQAAAPEPVGRVDAYPADTARSQLDFLRMRRAGGSSR
jgi:hypothetical protein